jgi:hypothetical protein
MSRGEIAEVCPDRGPGGVQLLRGVVDDVDVERQCREDAERRDGAEQDCAPRQRRSFAKPHRAGDQPQRYDVEDIAVVQPSLARGGAREHGCHEQRQQRRRDEHEEERAMRG